MCLGDSYKHENSKDNEAKLGMYVLSDKEEKGGTVLDFKSENGWFTANWGTAEHAEGPPTQTRITFWRVGPLWYRLPLLGECSRNTSVSVYLLALLWEAAFGSSEFFKKTLSKYLPISWWVIYELICLHHTECSAVFDEKQHDRSALPSLFTLKDFCLFVLLDEKSP